MTGFSCGGGVGTGIGGTWADAPRAPLAEAMTTKAVTMPPRIQARLISMDYP